MQRSVVSFETIFLMGLLPILSATYELRAAMLTTGFVIVMALVIRLFWLVGKRDIAKPLRWAAALSIGSVLAYTAAEIAPLLLPGIHQSSAIYFYLLAVTPLIYIGAIDDMESKGLAQGLGRFLLIMVTTSLIREFIGTGSIWNRAIFTSQQPLLDTVAEIPGAFIVSGTILLLHNVFVKEAQ